jgi:hypothetical protein
MTRVISGWSQGERRILAASATVRSDLFDRFSKA